MPPTLIALWLVILAGVLASWFLAFRVHYQLRSKNTALWSQLGSPSFVRSGARLRHFLRHGSGELKDGKLGSLVRTQGIIHIGVGVAVLAFLVVVLLQR
jgi:hypothetical protein